LGNPVSPHPDASDDPEIEKDRKSESALPMIRRNDFNVAGHQIL
jgi:hypothetical protein